LDSNRVIDGQEKNLRDREYLYKIFPVIIHELIKKNY